MMMRHKKESQVQDLRFRAATYALAMTLVLTAGKIMAAVLSHSVSVFSEGIHSSLDLVSAAIAFFTIREAGMPADEDHPYGHGRIETLSSLLESGLLIIAALFIVLESIHHLIRPEPILHQGIAIFTIFVSLVLSYIVFLHNRKAGEVTQSSAIQVNALHFFADAVTSAGVLVALVLIRLTGFRWLDPVVGLIIAGYIVSISWRQVRSAIHELVDSRLTTEEVTEIEAIIAGFQDQMIEAHDLKTRKSGVHRFAEFHLIQCGLKTVEDSHRLCDAIEDRIQARIPGMEVTIHVESCSHLDLKNNFKCPVEHSGTCTLLHAFKNRK